MEGLSMTDRPRTVLLTLVILAVAVVPAGSQTTTGTLPLTPWGHPDLQGQWNSQTSIPLERPLEGPLSGRDSLTEEEAAALEQENRARYDLPPSEGNPGTYNAFWRDFGTPLTRTSLIIDPPNGRRPPRKETARSRRGGLPGGASDGPESRGLGDRCLHFDAPRMASGYNSYFQVFQTPDQVTIIQEMGHIVRSIPLDGRPHLGDKVRQWAGNAQGRWEGDTLVVETRNYESRSRFSGGSEGLVLVERFSRVAPNVLRQEVTLTDPDTWTQPWTVELLHDQSDEAIFEYACHEGNYAMAGILGGARAEERAADSR